MSVENSIPSIEEIIRNGEIKTVYQPIISIRRGTHVAAEALTRANYKGETISPYELFKQAEKEGETLTLDRKCREIAINTFNGNQNLTLFLNVATAILQKSNQITYLNEQVKAAGFDPTRIGIEILETGVYAEEELERFATTYSNLDYIIGVDDFGARHSNFDRLDLLQPDIMKIDRAIISNAPNEQKKIDSLTALVGYARSRGMRVIAEGIETEEEALLCMEMDIDMMQGYFFSEPITYEKLTEYNPTEMMIELKGKHQKRMEEKVRTKRQNDIYRKTILSETKTTLKDTEQQDFIQIVRDVMARYSLVDSAYILDNRGRKIFPTISHTTTKPKNPLFITTEEDGIDHSSIEHFLYLKLSTSDNEYYTSTVHVNRDTDNRCITTATPFTANHKRFYLCFEYKE